jgi:hypothetical protein
MDPFIRFSELPLKNIAQAWEIARPGLSDLSHHLAFASTSERKEECQFCDINHNYREQIAAGRPYTGVKKIEDILMALELIAASDSRTKAYTVTGGSVTSKLAGKTEVEFYTE